MRMVTTTITLLMIAIASGCGTTSPYVEIGVGYTLDGMTDYWLQTDREWTCDNHDTFHIEVGAAFDNNLTLGYHHQSHLSCGGPFNNNSEVTQDELILTKRWGGNK